MIALAAILGVPQPDDLRHEVGGIFDAVSFSRTVQSSWSALTTVS